MRIRSTAHCARWVAGAAVAFALAACGGDGGGGASGGTGGTDPFGQDSGRGGSGEGGSVTGGSGAAGGAGATGGQAAGGAGGQAAGGTSGAGGDGPRDAGADAGCACPGRQTCDPSTGACVEPGDCQGHEDCRSPRVCVERQCRDMCRGDGDCPVETHCDPGTQACVSGSRCADDGACGEGRRCADGACVAACSAEPCPGAQLCEAATGLCNEPATCTGDVDCLAGRVCRDQVCLSPCVENAMCPGAQTCLDGRCTEPAICHGNLDCAANRVCSGGVCLAHCAEAGCPGGLLCDPSGACTEATPCADDTGCFDGRLCRGGACDSPCVDSAECPGALRCEAGACIEGPDCVSAEGCLPGRVCAGGACIDPCGVAGCPGALRCDGDTGLCEEDAPCRDDAGCLPGRACVGGACAAGCIESAQCPGSMQCVDNRCAEPAFCRGPLDCFTGRICSAEGACRPGCDALHPCSGTLQCAAGVCVEGADCAADRDCLEGRVCNLRLHTCAASCAGGAACPPGTLCSPEGYCQLPFCGVDADCAPGEGCLRGTCQAIECHVTSACAGQVCVDGQCLAEAPGACDCPAGWTCETGVCAQPGPCAGSPCPAGWQCLDTGACGLCARDADCGAGQCDAGFCTEAARCAAAGDCLPGRLCSAVGVCEGAACVDDDLSPNHAPDFAVALETAVHTRRVACAGRDDWYLVEDAAGLRVTARFAADRRPLHLALYPLGGAFGTPIDESDGVPGETWVTAPAGRHLLHVAAAPGAEGDYTLEITGGIACRDDAFERPWRNDDPDSAAVVGLGRHAGSLCGNDADHFDVSVGGRLRLTLEGRGTARAGGMLLPATVDGPASVAITGGPGAYTLIVESQPAPAVACGAAENGALNASFDATVGAAARDDFAPVCHAMGGTERVFRLRTPGTGRLQARLDSPAGSAALVLYRDCALEPLTCSGAMGDLGADVVAGDHFLVVEGAYSGNVRVDFVARPAACDRPPVLASEVPTNIVPVGADAPFAGACLDASAPATLHQFTLDHRTVVTLALTGGGETALLGLRSACGSAEVVQCAPGDGGRMETTLGAGTYFVTVQGAGPMSLLLTTAEPPAGFTDACDGPAAPLDIGDALTLEGSTSGMADDVAGLCGAGFGQADQIWRFRLAQRAEVTVRLAQVSFFARFYLVDGACGAERACPGAADQSVRATLDPGDYALVVDGGDLGQSGTFQAIIQATEP